MKMMRFKLSLIGIIAVFSMLIHGCAEVQLRAPMDILGFETVATLSPSENIAKAVYDSRSGTIYAQIKEWQMINLYRDGKKINSIGGLGSEKGNFHRLSDITLDTNGNLLALDGIEKKLKIFDSEGKWLQEIDLKNMLQPELVTMTADQTLFIYDALAGEIVCYSALDRTEQYHFGKFQILKPQSISCNRDYVVIYESKRGISHVYSVLGQYIRTTPGQILYDYYGNQLDYHNTVLSSPAVSQVFITPNWAMISLDREYLALAMRNEIQIVKINYQRVER